MQVKSTKWWLLAAAGALAILLVGAVEPWSQAAADQPECVSVRKAARSTGYGFDHVVYVRNECSVAVKCVVATNRDPKPGLTLRVPPGREKGVVTRTNAKKRNFKPVVSCERQAKADSAPVHHQGRAHRLL